MQDNFVVWGLNSKSVGITIYSNLSETTIFKILFELTDFDVALRCQSINASVAETQI